jgi:hypothetical protein
MKIDNILAGAVAIVVASYFVSRRVAYLLFWVIITFLVSNQYFHLNKTLSILLGIVVSYGVAMYTVRYTMEGFDTEEKEKEKKSEPEPHTTKGTDPHVDIGTTILHAYRNLTPEQIGGMRRDTKELLGLQKELMGTLSDMKPAIEQGAQLLSTFHQFFGQ